MAYITAKTNRLVCRCFHVPKTVLKDRVNANGNVIVSAGWSASLGRLFLIHLLNRMAFDLNLLPVYIVTIGKGLRLRLRLTLMSGLDRGQKWSKVK